ncbi:helix-turn-helix domain-containing protein [Candidimonas humi]|nr:helix-turn-helix domain-containing protein [Candidimonas humi]
MDRIEMSRQEIKRLELVSQVLAGKLSQQSAAQALSLTTRQVRRLQRRYQAQGPAGQAGRLRRERCRRRCAGFGDSSDAIKRKGRRAFDRITTNSRSPAHRENNEGSWYGWYCCCSVSTICASAG